jgi:hypothetical protein
LIHPAGFIFFGEINIFVKLLASMNNNAQPGWLLPAGLININIAQIQIGPISFNDAGSYVEKTWTFFPNGSSQFKKIGMWNHWENNKFTWWGSNQELAHYTIQDSINNNIRTQLGTISIVIS